MATVGKSSLTIVNGGHINRSAGGGSISEFSVASNQYAIVTVTHMEAFSGNGAVTASLALGGVAIVSLIPTAITSQTLTLVQGFMTGNTAQSQSPPFQIYIAPGEIFQTFITLSGSATASIVATYVIFQNS